MQRVARELLVEHSKVKPTDQITKLNVGDSNLGEAIKRCRFKSVLMRSVWISATREIPMGKYAYGSQVELRPVEEHATNWTVSRRVYVIYRGIDTKAWEYSWEIDPISAP
jgi:hypothetical protein